MKHHLRNKTTIKKLEARGGNVSQWQGVCLACSRPWVWFLAQKKNCNSSRGVYVLKTTENRSSKKWLHVSVHPAPNTKATRRENPKCTSVDECTNKLWDLHVMEYYSGIKMDGILTHTTARINSWSVILSERSLTQRPRCWMLLTGNRTVKLIKMKCQLGSVVCVSSSRRLKQESHEFGDPHGCRSEFKATLYYKMRPCLKKQNTQSYLLIDQKFRFSSLTPPERSRPWGCVLKAI